MKMILNEAKYAYNKIILFDIDDTLVKSPARVIVVDRKTREPLEYLSTSEFNYHRLKPGEAYDYSEFNDFDILEQAIPTKYWMTLRREIHRGTSVGIVTARSNAKLIRHFFHSKRVRLNPEYIFAVNDPALGLHGTIDQRKAQVVESLMDEGFDEFIFFDDNVDNLNSVKKLEQTEGIRVITIQV